MFNDPYVETDPVLLNRFGYVTDASCTHAETTNRACLYSAGPQLYCSEPNYRLVRLHGLSQSRKLTHSVIPKHLKWTMVESTSKQSIRTNVHEHFQSKMQTRISRTDSYHSQVIPCFREDVIYE
jgi:hypothetical protein